MDNFPSGTLGNYPGFFGYRHPERQPLIPPPCQYTEEKEPSNKGEPAKEESASAGSIDRRVHCLFEIGYVINSGNTEL